MKPAIYVNSAGAYCLTSKACHPDGLEWLRGRSPGDAWNGMLHIRSDKSRDIGKEDVLPLGKPNVPSVVSANQATSRLCC